MSNSIQSTSPQEKKPTFKSIMQSNWHIIVILTVFVLLLCVFYLYLQWNRYQTNAASEAIHLAKSVEALLHQEHIAELSGTLDDLEKPEYNAEKDSLIRLVKTTRSIRFAYVFGVRNGNIVFLLDSETPDSPDYSPPGQIYTEATDADWKPFLTGESILTGPLSDRWGTWISASVPILKPDSDDVIAVLGLDYEASIWQANVFSQMTSDFISVIIFLVLYSAIIHIEIHRALYKRLNEILEWDEAFYHSVFEQAPIGIAIVKDKHFEIQPQQGSIGMNPMFMAILQRTSQEIESIQWPEITHPDDLQADMEQFERFQKGEINGYAMEKRFIRPDESSIWTYMIITPLIGLPNANTMHMCLLEDISERKEAENKLRESDRSKSVLVSNLPGMAYRCNFDKNWTMEFVSEGCIKLTGYSPDMLVNSKRLSFHDIIASKYRSHLWNHISGAVQKRLSFRAEYEIITADENRKWVLDMGEGVYDQYGEVEALEGIILDISDRKKSENQLQKMLTRTQAMINHHQAVMLLIEPVSGNIIEANSAAVDFYGYTKEELLRMTIQDINMTDKEEILSLRMKALEKGQKFFTFPHRLKNGTIRMVDVYSSPIEYDDTKVMFSIIFDVTERQETAKQNEYLAYHDYLTGLYNRRFFEEEFLRRVSRGDFPIGLFLGDVDGFKVYNDTYGHAEGDAVLLKITNNLRTLVGQDGLLARIGGDEFSILISGLDKHEMRKYLDKLNHEYDTTFDSSLTEKTPTISWGYALQKDKDDSLDKLLEEAEAFMYNRKFYSTRSVRSKAVDIIMETLFTKSEREKLHSERVGILSEEIAKQMHLSNAKIDQIRVAGMLHDIGKIGIDEAILNKAGKLDADEWEMIKLHPAKSAGILDKTQEYQNISSIVLSHHERFDGQGYPGKLSAEAIPLGARIIAVADAYDAMTNDRPYKKALDKAAAVEALKKSAGVQLDPEIVAVFIDKVLGEIE